MNDEQRYTRIGNDAVDWDDRKKLADIWQDHTPLPTEGLSSEVYSALLAVARWGARQAAEILDD